MLLLYNVVLWFFRLLGSIMDSRCPQHKVASSNHQTDTWKSSKIHLELLCSSGNELSGEPSQMCRSNNQITCRFVSVKHSTCDTFKELIDPKIRR